MSDSGAAARAWTALEPAWRDCLELAWQSFRQGGIAVGAVLAGPDGEIVSQGQNRRRNAVAGPAAVTGLLGHAEINALAAVPADKERSRGYVLYTSLSPCPMCLGATVIARIAAVRFAAADPTWAGIERMPGLNAEVRDRWPDLAAMADRAAARYAARPAPPATARQALAAVWDDLAAPGAQEGDPAPSGRMTP
jgi:tRNA(Arg) A34 adenosine deaminase TadA